MLSSAVFHLWRAKSYISNLGKLYFSTVRVHVSSVLLVTLICTPKDLNHNVCYMCSLWHTRFNACAGVFVSDTFFAKIGCVWFLSNRYKAVCHFLFGVSPVVIFVVVVVSSLCTRERLGRYQYLWQTG